MEKQSLSSKLLSIAENAPKDKCTLGNIFLSLDDDSRRSLSVVLESTASVNAIYAALREDGLVIDRHNLSVKRKCFNENPLCTCKGLIK